jgi:hypothetical protein
LVIQEFESYIQLHKCASRIIAFEFQDYVLFFKIKKIK